MYVSAKIYQIEASVFHHLQMKVPPSWKYCWNNLWWWGFLFTFTAVLDDLPAPGGLQGLPDLRANLPVAAGVLYGLVCPFSPKISKETKVFWRWQKQSYKDGDMFRNPPAPPTPCTNAGNRVILSSRKNDDYDSRSIPKSCMLRKWISTSPTNDWHY